MLRRTKGGETVQMAQQDNNQKKGFAGLVEAEKKYDRRAQAQNRPAQNVKRQNKPKTVREGFQNGDEYYEW